MAVNTTKSTPNPYADELAPTSHTCAVRLIIPSMQYVFLLRDPFSLNLLAVFRSWFITYVAACPPQCQQTQKSMYKRYKNTHTNKKKQQQFKDLIPLPSAQQTRPSQEKQIDRRHEMIGEEFDGKKVRSHVSLNKQPFHSRKGSRRHKYLQQKIGRFKELAPHQANPRRGRQPLQSHPIHLCKSKWVGYKAPTISGTCAIQR